MRMSALYVIGMALAMTPWLMTASQAAIPQRQDARSSQIIRVAEACPAGQHWEESGYIAEGKWRNAGCYKNGGRE